MSARPSLPLDSTHTILAAAQRPNEVHTHNEQPLHPAEKEGSSTPWLTVDEAAARARCGIKLIYREVQKKRLKAARVGGRRELRLRPEWVDAWLDAAVTF